MSILQDLKVSQRRRLLKAKNMARLFKAAKKLVQFCYSNGAWIGSETIRDSTSFLQLCHDLYLVVVEIEGELL